MAQKRLIILLILSIVFGQIIRIPLNFIGPSVVLTPLDGFATALVFAWFVSKFKTKKPFFRYVPLAFPISLFVLVAFFSLLFNLRNLAPEEVLVSFLYLFRWSLLAGVYFVVREFDSKTKSQLLVWLAAVGILLAVLGIVQYFLYPDLRNLFYAGWDEHLYRIFGTFLDPNFAGAFFVLTLVLLLGLSLQFKKQTKPYLMLVIGLALTFVAMVLTYSRSTYLMFLVTIPIFLILVGKRKLLSIILALFIVGVLLLPKNLPSEGVNLLRTASTLARGESAQNALHIFADHPILGVGFNAYRYTQIRYGFIDEPTVHSGAGTDNSFLFVLATTGVIGFTAFIYLLYRIFAIAKLSDNLTSKVVIASLTGLLINSFFINSLFYESILVWLWILIGAMETK